MARVAAEEAERKRVVEEEAEADAERIATAEEEVRLCAEAEMA